MQLATLLVARRASGPPPDLALLESVPARRVGTAHHEEREDARSPGGPCPPYKPRLIDMPPMHTSSSEVRRRLATGQSIDDLVPPAVAQYIAKHGLYREPPA